jgi:transcriptional regulator with XRE-family HTH domain
MNRLWVFVQAYLDDEDRPAAWLAHKIGTTSSTLNTWKIRGSRPGPDSLHKLARAINVDYAILLAAIDADGGYITNDDLDAVLDSKRISPEMRERLRATPHIPSMDVPDKPDTGPDRR